MIAEDPRLLTGEMMASRIYSPFAYQPVRRLPIVPIVACEAERLGGAFPIAWRKGEDGPELVVLRTLLEDGTGYPPGVDKALGLLPLILQGYPFVLPPDRAARSEGRRMIDAVSADEPTDAGAPITVMNGRLSRGTELRLHALQVYESDFATTAAIGRTIAELDLFEPWKLSFDLGGGRRCEIPGLFIFSQKAFDTPRVAPLLARHGSVAARLLGVHRLSLFRAGVLLGAARAACAAGAGNGGTP